MAEWSTEKVKRSDARRWQHPEVEEQSGFVVVHCAGVDEKNVGVVTNVVADVDASVVEKSVAVDAVPELQSVAFFRQKADLFLRRIFYVPRPSIVAQLRRRSIQRPFVARFPNRSFPSRRDVQLLRRPFLARAGDDDDPRSIAQPEHNKKFIIKKN